MTAWKLGPGNAKPFRRWTADTERAFLLALRLTGQVKLAAAEIGRTAGGAYERRNHSPGFAEAWGQVLAEQQAACALPGDPATRRPRNRTRCDGWTLPRQKAFLRALAETGSVRAACAKVGVSTTSAYRFRKGAPDYAAMWEEALDRGAMTPEEALRQRAVEGWDEPIVQGGRVVATRRRYSDGLLKWLMQETARAAPKPENVGKLLVGEGETVRGGKVEKLRATHEESLAALERQLDAVAKRARREEREQALAWEADMKARGLAP